MSDLGQYDGGYGSVDLFGLDEFGMPVGLGSTWGAVIGAAVQSSSAAAIRHFANKHKYSEMYGALAGVAVGGAMFAMGEKARYAGITAGLVALVNGGIRTVEKMLVTKEKVADVTKENTTAAGMGLVEVSPHPTIGLPTIEPTASIGGLGMPPQLVGAGDYGMGQNPAAQQAELVGPGFSGLSSHFGHTIFG
jgi:hypothetical protein